MQSRFTSRTSKRTSHWQAPHSAPGRYSTTVPTDDQINKATTPNIPRCRDPAPAQRDSWRLTSRAYFTAVPTNTTGPGRRRPPTSENGSTRGEFFFLLQARQRHGTERGIRVTRLGPKALPESNTGSFHSGAGPGRLVRRAHGRTPCLSEGTAPEVRTHSLARWTLAPTRVF